MKLDNNVRTPISWCGSFGTPHTFPMKRRPVYHSEMNDKLYKMRRSTIILQMATILTQVITMILLATKLLS